MTNPLMEDTTLLRNSIVIGALALTLSACGVLNRLNEPPTPQECAAARDDVSRYEALITAGFPLSWSDELAYGVARATLTRCPVPTNPTEP